MGKIAVVYWSGTGNTENMAHAVADGARKGGASSVDEVTPDQFSAADVEKYDAFCVWLPCHGQ
jgi:flavodoxin I